MILWRHLLSLDSLEDFLFLATITNEMGWEYTFHHYSGEPDLALPCGTYSLLHRLWQFRYMLALNLVLFVALNKHVSSCCTDLPYMMYELISDFELVYSVLKYECMQFILLWMRTVLNSFQNNNFSYSCLCSRILLYFCFRADVKL